MTQYVLEFDYRSDGGPRLVGPFNSREEAWAAVPVRDGFKAAYCVVPLAAPEVLRQP
jgi:hypothetical protein